MGTFLKRKYGPSCPKVRGLKPHLRGPYPNVQLQENELPKIIIASHSVVLFRKGIQYVGRDVKAMTFSQCSPCRPLWLFSFLSSLQFSFFPFPFWRQQPVDLIVLSDNNRIPTPILSQWYTVEQITSQYSSLLVRSRCQFFDWLLSGWMGCKINQYRRPRTQNHSLPHASLEYRKSVEVFNVHLLLGFLFFFLLGFSFQFQGFKSFLRWEWLKLSVWASVATAVTMTIITTVKCISVMTTMIIITMVAMTTTLTMTTIWCQSRWQ